jgi:hypothetical protein
MSTTRVYASQVSQLCQPPLEGDELSKILDGLSPRELRDLVVFMSVHTRTEFEVGLSLISEMREAENRERQRRAEAKPGQPEVGR